MLVGDIFEILVSFWVVGGRLGACWQLEGVIWGLVAGREARMWAQNKRIRPSGGIRDGLWAGGGR